MVAKQIQKKFDDLNVGDILVGVLINSMTIHHFYEVVGKTKCSVKIQKLDQIQKEGPLYATPVQPIMGKYVGDVLTRRMDKFGDIYENGKYSPWISLSNKYDPNHSYLNNYMD